METQKFKPNSHKYKMEQKQAAERENAKKVDKVIRGKATIKKKSGFQKFLSTFITTDAKDVKSYLFEDVFVPTIKKAIYDVVSIVLDGKTSDKKKSSVHRVSYRNYYDRYDDDRRSSDRDRGSTYDIENIILDSRAEAEAVLDGMSDVIADYKEVTVADLYDMLDLTAPWTSNKYGWTNISDARPRRTRDGWVLDLPRPKCLK